MSNPDQIQRFIFDDTDVRGVLTGTDAAYQAVLQSHEYPVAIQRLLGEMLAAVSLLSSTLKFSGRLGLQARGEGAVSLMMAECNHQHDLRAIARWEGTLDEDAGLLELLGRGQLVITIEPEKGQRYQGVVALERPQLAQCLESYFQQSEQLATRILLAADGDKAAGMLLQALPAKEQNERYRENWDRIAHLGATLSSAELLTLDNQTLLYRLYHEEALRLFDPEPLRFACDCSRERSLGALRTLGEEEVASMLDEAGRIALDCQFCNARYEYDRADIQQLFSDSSGITPSPSRH
ncbi:Hsp33 family molecular chaperone HslO [Motiliproteus sp. SC1-56]|uniref:Hsp33 family molecular chaperone HslO n=1 Tax=Motiliproteus sp. SC1-56 TaxID=2799565 RepID=UPI001A8DB273|nr:Hsp33 family molecular chaperone HslO [Motiliproteus sp. SC1-56]